MKKYLPLDVLIVSNSDLNKANIKTNQ